jgi:filamentous hemagglutinin family protein
VTIQEIHEAAFARRRATGQPAGDIRFARRLITTLTDRFVLRPETSRNRLASPGASVRCFPAWRRLSLAAFTALVAPALCLAQTLPQGGRFVAGQGSIGAAAGNALTIDQTSARGIIDWHSFSIGPGASVTFQNGAGATLNRVTGGDLSQILGSLRATGSLYLVNPQGVVVGSSGVVVTGGRFVASSLDIANDAFLAGSTLVFRGSTQDAEIRNLGDISSTGGDVILISRAVRNEGSIAAPRGTAALAAGTEVVLREGPDRNRGMVRVGGSSGDVATAGRIEAAQAELRAAGGNIYALAGNTQGVVRATGTETRAGRVWLSAGAGTAAGNVVNEGTIEARNADGAGGKVSVRAGNAVLNTGSIAADGHHGGEVRVRAARVVQQGTVAARGSSAQGGQIDQRVTASYIDTARAVTAADGRTGGGAVRIEAEGAANIFASGRIGATGGSGTGGTLHLLGERITLMGAQIDASGVAGGGSVRIGGGMRGGEGLPQAREVTINPATTIRADAGENGHGGSAVIWSTERTRFHGRMTARGGAQGGDGGQLEISSAGELVHAGQADAAAPSGKAGTLLLDPKAIVIDDSPPSTAGAAIAFGIESPTPTAFGNLSRSPVILANGNIVVAADMDDTAATAAGAVFLFDGTTGALISMLTGGQANDRVGLGGVTALASGNYVVVSQNWDRGTVANAGAVTWGSGTTGVSGQVSPANSLVGARADDQTGLYGVTALANGNYVIASPLWDRGTVVDAGAVTWASGATGIRGEISAANSLVGAQSGDQIGGLRLDEAVGGSSSGVRALTGGNYVVGSPSWNRGAVLAAGAATWGNGATGISGEVSPANSLVGAQRGDRVGRRVVALTNGNYVVASENWARGAVLAAGAATWGNGATGISGEISSANSLVGTQAGDFIGSSGVTALTNGNYVVKSPGWKRGAVVGAGAATWGNGATGTSGEVSPANSLVGTSQEDQVGREVTALANGNYVVSSTGWNRGAVVDAGAATWGNGMTGISGEISPANSLVGTQANDGVGFGIAALANGNYVVSSPGWTRGAVVQAGASTWGNGAAGVTGEISPANSLVGAQAYDGVGRAIPLANGNYVVSSPNWDRGAVVDAGAVTWGNGMTGVSGEISPANSLVGTQANDRVGSHIIGTALANGNYVVRSPNWDRGSVVDAGAVTWGDGMTGVSGEISAANSLVGTQSNDRVGELMQASSSTGAYLVQSPSWSNGNLANAGAVTWGSGTAAVAGPVSAANSIVGGAAAAQLGSSASFNPVTGHFVVRDRSGNGRFIALRRSDPLTEAGVYLQQAGDTITLSATQLAATLATGTAVTLQASTDITVAAPVTVGGTSGGALTLQAGRSILLGASLASANGTVTLIANDRASSGVVDAQRDPGPASIAMSAGTMIATGSGNVVLRLLDGAGNTNREIGSVSLGTVQTTGALSIDSQGPVMLGGAGTVARRVTVATAGALTLAAPVIASGTGDALVLSGDEVRNTGGSLDAPNGRWLVFAADPGRVTPGGLTAARWYGRSYAGFVADGTPIGAGNRFVFGQAPVLTVTASDQAIIYGRPVAQRFVVSGLVNGDTDAQAWTGTPVISAGSGQPHVGTTALTIRPGTLASDYNYGFAFAAGTLFVAPATLTITAHDMQRSPLQPNPPFGFSVSGLVAGDGPGVIQGLALTSPATATSLPGRYPIVPTGGSAADYVLVGVPGVLTVLPLGPDEVSDIDAGNSNIPLPLPQMPQLQAAIDDPVATAPPRVLSLSAMMPLRQASRGACGANFRIEVYRCASGFPSPGN